MSMHFEYKKLFSVEVKASNNTPIIGEVFRYAPTLLCDKLLEKFGLVYNTFSNGFTVYYKLDKTRPLVDQLASEFSSKQIFTFVFNIINHSSKLQFSGSFNMSNGPQFYLNNLDNTTIKPNGASLHINTALGDADNMLLSAITELGTLGHYQGKRISDSTTVSFDLNTKPKLKKPFGVLEIVIDESQKTFNNIEYSIKLKAS